jgi:initiation factor 1A|tara:strand:+ start:1324 stop:1857 length:534 start_codon:yes stop_codon:yes gene_type:complete
MVKNKTGGNRHKKQARKNVNAPVSVRLRIPKEEGEILAKVMKLFGNSMAEVLCEDKVTRLLIIRKRFKGRNKRDNNIAVNKVLLVGRRLWEVVNPKKKQKVDLLYVYSDGQIDDLRQKVNVNSIVLPDYIEKEEEIAYDLSSKNDWKDEKNKTIVGDITQTENTKISKIEEFDFDDI